MYHNMTYLLTTHEHEIDDEFSNVSCADHIPHTCAKNEQNGRAPT